MAKAKIIKKEKKVEKDSAIKFGYIKQRPIVQEMQESYLDYAMSVIVSRALPDVRDGLKPVHRRILYTMWTMGLRAGAKFRKSAAVVGDCLGKLHPHGDIAVYDSLTRLAQDFSMRYPLVKGQGNFGCFTKDTKIKLTDNRNLSFEELIKENAEGKKNYTYTINKLGLISIAKIQNPRLTRKKAEIIKVVLDNGAAIKCTPNHLFMRRDGTYKMAQDLKPQDSLMPLYQKISEKSDRINREGYILIYQNKTGEWIPTHHLADNYNLTFGKYRKSLGRARHHIDFNKLNNNPELIHQEINKNHRVIKVEKIQKTEDVYDLTINTTHNFCLADGIFVHNSIDGDAPAAQRYTEAKLSRISEEMLYDLEKETVKFIDNYDATQQEPSVLPAKFPNILLNGSMGIAVGMATNIPPHNLTEVADGTIHLIDNPDATVEDLTEFVKGPDFPTAGYIFNKKEIAEVYKQGKGAILMRGKAEIVEGKKDFYSIIISEIPYQVNKSEMIEHLANLVRDKKLEGIRDIRDESDKDGIRIVIELKREAFPKKVLNQLYANTRLQEKFHVNMLALVDGIQPRVLNLKNLLEYYIKHRKEVITKRAEYDLKKAKERAHILEGLKKAIDHISEIIRLIRQSKDRDEAAKNLIKRFKFTAPQTQAILEMKLSQLAALERLKIEEELKEKKKLIKELMELLSSPKKILGVVKKELIEVKEKYGDERRTKIIAGGAGEFTAEDLIPNEQIVITITHGGYIKSLPDETYRAQKRGGKGVKGMEIREEDVIEHCFAANTHANVLFFTNSGKVFQLKAYEIPKSGRTSKGQSIVNFLQLNPEEHITAIVPIEKKAGAKFLAMVTKNAVIKKVELDAFDNVRHSGLIAIKIKSDDELKWVKSTSGEDDIILITAFGQSIRFKENNIRAMGRQAAGVRGMKLKGKDKIIGMDIMESQKSKVKSQKLLILTENGYGKQSDLKFYKVQGRGGSGIKTVKVTSKNGQAVFGRIMTEAIEELLIISKKGQVIRIDVGAISDQGRATQGVRVMRLDSADKIASVACI